jgi:RiboL-PSP-HEPN
MAVQSKAADAFVENFEDVKQLLRLHTMIGGSGTGRRHGLEVLNKAAIVLITAFWEAYCEDLAAEGLQHLLAHSASADKLPLRLRKQLAGEIKKATHELEMWKLAGDGWKTYLSQRLKRLSDERNRGLNTPKPHQLDELFEMALGIDKISDRWSWKGASATRTKKNLNDFVELRGSIAHRGKDSESVTRKQVTDYRRLVGRLAEKTDETVNQYVFQQTGAPLFDR